MRYRPEIDGLRTLAVFPVVFFHAAIGPFSGGFAGVDVFFVISGYLITSILIDDLEAGTYSIVHFYERRARRILPALFLVCLCSSVAAWIFLYPAEFNEFGQSLVATSVFLSNVFFWLKSDYFSTAAELKPLLHTWSLAVEEQFYILFPLFLAAIWAGVSAWRRCLFWLSALALASLVLCLWTGQRWNAIAFYMLPFRAWELLMGAIVAVILKRHMVSPHRLLAWIGLVLLAASLAIPSEDVWPSALTLLPTTGTALIILFARADHGVGRLLSWQPMVWGGLISYSLYLWHQPVLAFARILSFEEPSVPLKLALIVLSVLLATLSWYYVEQLFRVRKGQARVSRNAVFSLSAIAIAATVAIGAAIDFRDGWPERRTFSGMSFAAIETDLAGLRPEVLSCTTELVLHAPPSQPKPECVFPAETEAPARTALMIGDSHADMLSGAMRDLMTRQGYDLTIATFRGCMPFPGFRSRQRDCDPANALTYDWVESGQFDVVIVVFRLPSWSEITTHLTLTQGADGGGDRVAATPDNFPPLVEAGLQRLLDHADDVVVVLPVPDMPENVRHFILKRAVFDADPAKLAIDTSYAGVRDLLAPVEMVFDRLDTERLHVVDGPAIFCDASSDTCPGLENGKGLYIDDNHLSASGVAKLLPHISEVIAGLR